VAILGMDIPNIMSCC